MPTLTDSNIGAESSTTRGLPLLSTPAKIESSRPTAPALVRQPKPGDQYVTRNSGAPPHRPDLSREGSTFVPRTGNALISTIPVWCAIPLDASVFLAVRCSLQSRPTQEALDLLLPISNPRPLLDIVRVLSDRRGGLAFQPETPIWRWRASRVQRQSANRADCDDGGIHPQAHPLLLLLRTQPLTGGVSRGGALVACENSPRGHGTTGCGHW